jgi:hypothetical protein
MKRGTYLRRLAGIFGLALGFCGQARASVVTTAAAAWELPNFDARAAGQPSAISPAQAADLARLRASVPGVKVDFDGVVGSPNWIASTRGFLTGPGGEGLAVSASPPMGAQSFSDDPDRPTKAFLAAHRDLFGHGPEVLDNNALIKRDFVTARSGLHTKVWQQQVGGIPVFDALLISHTTAKGELVGISSHFLANPQGSGASPALSAAQAVAAAAGNLDEPLSAVDVALTGVPGQTPEFRQTLRAAPFKGDIDARLVWLPMSRETMRLCWQLVIRSTARGRMFEVLVDAGSGEVLLRHCLTEDLSNASYLVFTSDSPTPMSPGLPAPATNQPPQVARVLVTTNAFDTNASPDGWINDGTNTTTGNNVDAYLDANGTGSPSSPRPQGSPPRVFTPLLDLTQDPTTNGDAAVVNLFYWNNWMHDRLYDLGFTEAAGNFQTTNFGRGGLGSDAVKAEAQEGGPGGSDNNASFTTPPDGMPGVMEMYIWSAPTPRRDGSLDTQVVLHEYTHGLSNRRVGGGVGITALQSRGLGEGWSDFYSLALLSNASNDVNGTYPEGAYVSYQYGGSAENYYFGIRRYPYCTDTNKDPVTFKDIDPNQADPHNGVPENPAISNPADEIHNQGEIWGAALWDARANLINQYGFSGNQLMLQLVTDGMNLTPPNPTFVEARDAVIQADIVDTGGTNYHLLWEAFAKRGLGYGAVAPANNTTVGVVESYLMPDDLLVAPSSDYDAFGPVGGPYTPGSQVYTLVNSGSNLLNWSLNKNATWLTISASSGTLNPSQSTNITVTANAVANTLPGGAYTDVLTFSNATSTVAQTRNARLSAYLLYFPLSTDPGWARQGQWAFGQPTGQGGGPNLGNPDPQEGYTGTNVFGVNLNGDYSVTNPGGPYYLTGGPFNFSGEGNITLDFERWLNSDYQPDVSATIDVSADGVNWTNVFTNDDYAITDAAWTNCQYDISAVADNQSSVYVRWGYQVGPDAFPYSGWNIDDIEFFGLPKLIVQVPSPATKGAGLLGTNGTVSLSEAPTTNVVVSLASSSAEVTVPATVTINAGQTNATFSITVGDNHLLDGTQVVSISAAAPNYSTGAGPLTVFDNESASLALSSQPSASEGDPPVLVTLTSSAAPAANITVTLTSSDTNSIQVPATVVLPSGQTSTSFHVNIISAPLISPNRNITLTAQVRNWTNGVEMILIHYNLDTNLTLSIPAQARQSNGTIANAGEVSLGGILLTNLPVSLASSNATELSVPPTVIIPAGLTSAVFNVTVVDTGHTYGSLPVQVGAGAQGFSGMQATITLTDDQTPPMPYTPDPPNLSTNNPVNLNLSWTPGVGEGVDQGVNGGFELGSFAGWTTSPQTNGGFIVDNGTFAPPSGDGTMAPYAGNYSALAYQQSTPGASVLSQDIALPAGASSIVLSWVDRIRNFASEFDTNQEFSVELRDTNDNTLAVAFTTGPSLPLLGDWTQRSFDVSAWRGRVVRVAFVVSAPEGYLDVHLDNVSVRASNLPAVNYSVYFGTNSSPGPGQLLGTTTNTSWPLPTLTPLVTYYWQIVAARGSQTPGPVWQFSSLSSLIITNLLLVSDYNGTTNAVFYASLDVPCTQTVSASFATADESAYEPGDYIATNGTLSFAPGQTNLSIPVLCELDTSDLPVRTFLLNLSNPGALLFSQPTAECTLVNATVAPPTLAPIPDQSVVEESTLTFTNTATNDYIPGEPLDFSLDPGAPGGASVDPATGVFTWTPEPGQGNTNYSITMRVTDAASAPFLSDAQTFNVTVYGIPPELTPIANMTVHVGTTVNFTAEATDPDSPPAVLTFTLDPGAPAGATIVTNTGVFTWTTPPNSVNTTNSITVRVTDNDTPPTGDASTFTIAIVPPPKFGPTTLSGGHTLLEWSSIANQVYRVEFSTNLVTWTSLPGDVTASGPTCTKLDPFPLLSQGFYRIMVLPQ